MYPVSQLNNALEKAGFGLQCALLRASWAISHQQVLDDDWHEDDEQEVDDVGDACIRKRLVFVQCVGVLHLSKDHHKSGEERVADVVKQIFLRRL